MDRAGVIAVGPGRSLRRPDGRRLLAAVAVFSSGRAQPLFAPALRRDAYLGYGSSYPYDVAPDGQRFILNSPVTTQGSLLTLLVNWPARLPGGGAD